jgi:hypothetical protein
MSVTEITPYKVFFPIAGLGALGALSATFIMMAKYTSSADSFQVIKDKIVMISVISIIGSVCLGAAVFLYYLQQPNYAIYFQMFVTCFALGLSFAALCVAAISR